MHSLRGLSIVYVSHQCRLKFAKRRLGHLSGIFLEVSSVASTTLFPSLLCMLGVMPHLSIVREKVKGKFIERTSKKQVSLLVFSFLHSHNFGLANETMESISNMIF